jgi:plastocyanin
MTCVRLAAVTLCFGLTACGGGGSSPAPAPTPSNPNVITISSGGVVSPKELTVAPGSRVLFVNSHSRRHDMASDPHPEHVDCPEINQVGLLNTGQSRESGNLNAVRTCGFHDHDEPDNANLRGRIVVR